MSWLLLAMAIVTEVMGTIALKFSNGLTDLKAAAVVVVAYVASFILLGLSLKGIELAIAYAIWAGVGTALIAVASIVIFHETMTTLKLLSISLIVVGVVGLNLASRASGA